MDVLPYDAKMNATRNNDDNNTADETLEDNNNIILVPFNNVDNKIESSEAQNDETNENEDYNLETQIR